MSKILKKLIFALFIITIIILIVYLGIIAYTDANCTRGINYIIEKYEIEAKELRSLKYQEYVYEDIADCNSLWFKKCTSEEDLLYEYTLKTKDNTTIVIKEYKDGTFSDNYEKGVIRKEYLKNNNSQNSLDNKSEAN